MEPTSLSRREFAQIAGLSALAGLAIGPRALAQGASEDSAGFFDWRPIADGAWAGYNGGGNALLYLKGTQAILVDSKNPGLGPVLRAEAEGMLPDGAVLSHVVLTHHHFDHSGGLASFKDHHVVLGHANGAERCKTQASTMGERARGMATALGRSDAPAAQRAIDAALEFADAVESMDASAFAPSETPDFSGGSVKINFDEGAAHLHHVGDGHTDNDVFVHVPQLNLIHTGDLLFHELHCFIDTNAGATTRGWEKSLQAMIDLCDDQTVVIPGHGELTDVSGLRGQIDYFQKLREFVGEQRAAGVGREDIQGMTPEVFEGRGFARMGPANLQKMWDELEAEG